MTAAYEEVVGPCLVVLSACRVAEVAEGVRMSGESGTALAGLRVVEFAHVIAGPLAGTLLADLGADVVHVEPPATGDTARRMGPSKDGSHLWWKVAGRNKRSVTIDLHRTEGRGLAQRLVAWADVVITSMRNDTLRRWGLDWDSVRRVNDKVILLQISGYGANGPLKEAPGFGKAGEARSGVVYLTGFPNGPPVHTGFSHADSITGLMGAFAVLSALYRRDRDNDFSGEWIDLALFEPLFRLIEWQVIVYDQLGIVPTRSGNRLAVAPGAVINTYQTADGEWVTVTSATARSVLNIVRLVGLSERAFQATEDQEEQANLLDSSLQEWVSKRSAAECLAEMERAGVVCSRVFSIADIMADPVYAAREDVITVSDPDLGDVRMQAVIPKLSRHPGQVWRTGPALGADNQLVLCEWLGLSREELAQLAQTGVV